MCNDKLKELTCLVDGKPCSHHGCLNHVTHPCEGCGRIGGTMKPQKNMAHMQNPYPEKICVRKERCHVMEHGSNNEYSIRIGTSVGKNVVKVKKSGERCWFELGYFCPGCGSDVRNVDREV